MSLLTAEAPADDAVDTVDLDDTGGEDWLELARDAYDTSTDYFDSSVRKRVEKNIAHFSNRHASGSKYHTESYKYRSKGFRPKTRAVIRKNEAAAATAFFATQDAVHIGAENESDPAQRVSAEINHELINYRLENSIRWFPTLIGAYQETLVSGVVVSHQYWNFEERVTPIPVMDPMTGEPVLDEMGEMVADFQRDIIHDKPAIELRPIENIRFSPSADWLDPMGTSPYIIDKIPMFIGDIKDRMQPGGKGQVPWYELSDGELARGVTEDSDSVRAQREGKREDSKDQPHSTTDFDIAWVHRNIIRRDNEDWLYYTLGTHYMLSEPVPLRTEYRHLRAGQRPYVLGFSILEPHKTYPAALTEMVYSLQQEANDINNQRRDNVSLVLNRRYYARRGATIDYRSLTRNIPGSVTLMDDINQDIRTEAPPDVTGSSYQEQDRVNTDFDELAGNFSQSSIASNRKLNETVGGMNMLQGDSNAMIEYQLRLFAETWAEPVLKQLVQLEQAYETDEAVLALVGSKISAWQKYGINAITDQMLQGSMTVRVNVGFGSTNPEQRVNKMRMGLDAIGTFAPQLIPQMDGKELITEVMGALGYRDGARFFPQTMGDQQQGPTPEQQQMQQMQQHIQQLEQQMQSKQMEIQGRLEAEKIKSQTTLQKAQMEAQWQQQEEAIRNEGRLAEARMDAQVEQMKLEYQRQIDQVNQQLQVQKNEIERGKLVTQRDGLIASMRIATAKIMAGQTKGDLTPGDYGVLPGGPG